MAHITFLGNPLALVGEPPRAGDAAPDFTLHRFTAEEGLVAVSLADTPRTTRFINVVPSLDTPTCSTQTKTFNERLAGLGDSVASYTVSLDLPFAQSRWCGSEGVENFQTLSDYQERSFGQNWGMLIDDLKLLARGVFVLDADGKITYAEIVKEVADEPDYDAALAAIEEQVRA